MTGCVAGRFSCRPWIWMALVQSRSGVTVFYRKGVRLILR